MISARVGLRVRALSGRLPLHWQEHSSRLSQWIQHTDFILYYSIYTPVLPQSTSALATQPCGYTMSPLQHGATHRVWPSVDPWVASPHLPLFYWNRWGTAIEAGGDRGLSVAPPSTHCPAIPMMRRPALRGTFALQGNPWDWDGLTGAKRCPGPPMPSLTAPKKFIPTPPSPSLILLPFLGGSPDNGKKLSH